MCSEITLICLISFFSAPEVQKIAKGSKAKGSKKRKHPMEVISGKLAKGSNKRKIFVT